MRAKRLVEQVEDAAKARRTEEREVPLFSTGATELNLACSDTIEGAFEPGTMANIIGDSFAGKTFLAHSVMAEAMLNPRFSHYGLVYDNKEAASTDGIEKMFGGLLTGKIRTPSKEGSSITIEDFQANAIRAVEAGPCIYVLDSFDAISSQDEMDRLDKMVAGKESKGSYKMERAKGLKMLLRNIVSRLRKNGSLLLIISQTIQNISPMAFTEKTRAGGDALKFFASHEIWLGLREKLTKTVNGRERMVGAHTRARVTKNRITGKLREADFRIFYDYGIDDLGDCVDFMVREKLWDKAASGVVDAKSALGIKAMRDSLIRQIEEGGLEDRLRRLVGKGWMEIEEKLRLNRKPRY